MQIKRQPLREKRERGRNRESEREKKRKREREIKSIISQFVLDGSFTIER